MALKPRSCKAKGRTFQQEIRQDLIKWFGIHELDIQSTAMGQAGCDLYLSRAARGVFPFGVETKNQETVEIWKWIRQCEANAIAADLLPLLVFRRNRTHPYAVLHWSDFCIIWTEILELRKKVEQLEGRR